ncbi:hypothetical protein PR003_g13198 [Phytophthora rubi]|uniref:FHA domain-containing protein n=1 Tax=Phytophthora rubi TaxID=129364 RepID=A0A6A3M5M1_9STRA|nr:hypothetical protein PR002_g12739 [Phytophthora rubi]KAE9025055.1 hypothetical protein PR001_g12525 [Phytophthora rubi]KAE9335078.1 hypothetical protein PR003_g13198 [Phytophthora rubi]
MKRKHATAAPEEQQTSPMTKKVKESNGNDIESKEPSELLDEMIDVQGFVLRDCQASSKKLLEQAKLRAQELRREFEAGKKVLLEALEAEKENLDKDGNDIPRAFSISVRCITGPYRGRNFQIDIDVKRHSSCFVGRSTGRKFQPPRGLSMPKDSELSTSHGEIKMEATGKIFFIDSDSTNGTRINDVELEAHEPYELTLDKPIKMEVGAGEYELTFEQKS